MNVFNKIVIILLLLVAMIVIPTILIFPEQAKLALEYAADVIQWNLDWLSGLTNAAQVGVRLLLAIAGMIVFLIGLLLLALEVIRFRKATVRLRDKGGELMVDSVAGHLAYHVDTLSGVLRVRPQVKSRGDSIRTTLFVETTPEVSVPDKSAEVRRTAQQVIEEQLGLKVDGEIRVVIKPVPYPRSRAGRAVQAAPAAAPVAAPVAAPEQVPEPPEPEPEIEVWVPAPESPSEGEESVDLWAPAQEPESEIPSPEASQEDDTPFATLDAKEPPPSSPG